MKALNKKIISILFVIGFSAVVFAESATITYVKGKVEVQRGGKWIALNAGDKVEVNEILNTGFQSEAKVKVQNSFMTLGALTRITITDLKESGNTQTVNVKLATGAVRSKVNHVENTRVNYAVRGPVAVASVRGTDYMTRADGFTTCYEGAVAVYPVSAENNRNVAVAEENPESEEVEENPEEMPEGAPEAEGGAPETDYGPADSTTPATEISFDAPSGAVVVGKGQQTMFTPSGNPSNPFANAETKMQNAGIRTASETEIVSASGEGLAVPGGNAMKDSTSTLVVTITIKE